MLSVIDYKNCPKLTCVWAKKVLSCYVSVTLYSAELTQNNRKINLYSENSEQKICFLKIYKCFLKLNFQNFDINQSTPGDLVVRIKLSPLVGAVALR